LEYIEVKIKEGGIIYLDKRNEGDELAVFDIGGVREFKKRKPTRDG
jgi:hypothetical protein